MTNFLMAISLMSFLIGCTSFKHTTTINSSIIFPEIETANKIVEDFQKRYNLPGVSIAISFENKLIYSAAVGWADYSSQIPLTPMYRMRIASVTKPITSIAIMNLYENNKLKLSDKVFGVNSILGIEYGLPMFNGQFADISIENLLSHTSGGWGNSKNDPMFMFLNLNGKELIQKVIKDCPLENEPGTHYDYSNFGYYLLGRIIEKITNQTYEDYVITNVLLPIGINGMRIGSNSKMVDEVVYYGSFGENPYFCDPHHIDAHGGWIANPIELLKLISDVSLFKNESKILKNDTIHIMTTRRDITNNYGYGFCVNKYNNWWHAGGLPGTSSEIGRTNDGYCWAILVNNRPSILNRKNYYQDLDQLFWKIRNAIKSWPVGVEL